MNPVDDFMVKMTLHLAPDNGHLSCLLVPHFCQTGVRALDSKKEEEEEECSDESFWCGATILR